jgi:hypothetical protein
VLAELNGIHPLKVLVKEIFILEVVFDPEAFAQRGVELVAGLTLSNEGDACRVENVLKLARYGGEGAVFLPAVLHQCVRMDKNEHPTACHFGPGAFSYFRPLIFTIVATVHLSSPDHQA